MMVNKYSNACDETTQIKPTKISLLSMILKLENPLERKPKEKIAQLNLKLKKKKP